MTGASEFGALGRLGAKADSVLGTRVVRVEDPALLTGKATYIANLKLPDLTYGYFVRSTIAHASLSSVDVNEARRAPGVVAVFIAADLGLDPFCSYMVLNEQCARPPLATNKVRFVGDAIAFVVADSLAAAQDAAELVEVDYEPLPAVVDPEAALLPGAPLQFEELGTNLVAGSKDPPEPDPLEGAAHVVRLRLNNQRIAVVPMEGNAVAAVPGDDGDGHDLTVYISTQLPHVFHTDVSRLLGLDPERVRVVAPNVGGGFGAKAGVAAEHLVTVAAARRLNRPVVLDEARSENLVAMPHGRGQVGYIEMGFDEDARITGMHVRFINDAGAYAGFGGAMGIGPTRMMAEGVCVYRIPSIRYDAGVAITNTTPMGAFRGAGRPEATEILERVIDLAADELGVDPVELRRRNLVSPEDFPITPVTGTAYDSCDYGAVLDKVIELSDYDQLRDEQAVRLERGDRVVLGIGVSLYVHQCVGGGGSEYGRVDIQEDGSATIAVGTSSHGQGHETSFSMIVADRLHIPIEAVRFIQSDTALVPRGWGTGGSRSLQVGGSAVRAATDGVLDLAKTLAAQELEASVEDIVVTEDGRVGVAGSPALALGWDRLAGIAASSGSQLSAAVDFAQASATFPYGAHVSVVEVDLDTGFVRPLRHIAVDDCGKILNPMIVAGQQHGGITQGMAQALWEEMVYDPDGNPLTTNLAEYAMPSGAEVPSFETANTETPSPLNPLGAKGIGESGTIGATPAVHNAVIDALSHLGVRHIEMPCTPMRVWEAAVAAEAGTLPPIWQEPPAALADLPLRGDGSQPEAAHVDI